MKKLMVMITMILCLGFSLVFAQDFEYTDFLKTVFDTRDGFAIINETVYEPGDVIKGSPYMLIKIEYDFVTLKNTVDGKTIKIGFKNGNRPKSN